jgi:hypothetical protein
MVHQYKYYVLGLYPSSCLKCPVYISKHESVLPEDGGRIQSPKRYVLLHKQTTFKTKDKTMDNVQESNKKVKLSLYRPWRPLGLREVEAPTFSDIWLIDGGKVVSPTRRPLFTPRKFPDTHFCYRLSRPQGYSAAGRTR